MRKLNEILPELGRIFTYDLERFEDLWLTQFDSLVDYTMAFEKLIYVVGIGKPEVERRAVEILEEFIASRQKPYEEWKSSNWLVHELGRVIGEELNKTYAKLQDLMPQLIRRMSEDSRYMEVFLPFDEIVSDYSHIMNYIVEIFSYPDTEAVSEALEALEAFLQGKETREGLKYKLGRIVSKFNDYFKEG
uniref:Uncharacterized protein n=1 Tax=Thermocrinis ruber TaxID=75906 RepID=A0A7C5X569_9AQUI